MTTLVTVLSEEPGTDDHWHRWLVIDLTEEATQAAERLATARPGKPSAIEDRLYHTRYPRDPQGEIDADACVALVKTFPEVADARLASHAGYFRE